MQYKIGDILDIEKINQLLESYTKATGLVSALLDLDGNVLTQSGWQNICTKFHRKNPESAKNCHKSDTFLAGQLKEGKKYNLYKCLNGLIDVAVPVLVNNEHIANLFTGQFFIEKPEDKYFIAQAEKYQFDKKEYMEAFSNVPRIKEEDIENQLVFLMQMTQVIAELGFAKVKQLELNKELKKSEDRFRAIISQAGDAMYLCDLEGNVKMVNNYSCEMLGYSTSEFIKMKIDDLDINYIEPELQKKLWNNLVPEKPQTLLTIHKHKDGSFIPVEIRYALINFDGNKAILGFVRDITERKQVEEKVLKSENGLLEAERIGKTGNWSYEVATGEVVWSDGMYRIYGRDSIADKVTYKKLVSWVHKEDMEIHNAFFEKMLRVKPEEELEDAEYRIVDGNGEEQTINIKCETLFDKSGKPTKFIGTMLQITESKQFTEELKNRNIYIESIMENMPIGFAVNGIDDGDVKYMNKLFEEIYGWTKDTLTNTSIFFDKVFPEPEYGEKMKTQIIADIQSGDPERMKWKDLKIVTSTGEERFVHAFNIPLIDQNIMISTVQDTTKRKLAEDEVLMHQEHLEELVRERTKTLEEKNNELERFNNLFVDREFRIKELKNEIEDLKQQNNEH